LCLRIFQPVVQNEDTTTIGTSCRVICIQHSRELRLWPFTIRENKETGPAYLDMKRKICKPLEESNFGLFSFSVSRAFSRYVLKYYQMMMRGRLFHHSTITTRGDTLCQILRPPLRAGSECRRRAHLTPDTPIRK